MLTSRIELARKEGSRLPPKLRSEWHNRSNLRRPRFDGLNWDRTEKADLDLVLIRRGSINTARALTRSYGNSLHLGAVGCEGW